MTKFYVVCDDDCRYEGMTREQILTAIQQAAEQGFVSDPDSAVFSKIKELRTGTSTRLWIGTEAQFNGLGLAPTIAKTVVRVGTDGVLYLCTDDTTIPDVMPVEAGGTGATTVEAARTNLGLPNPTTADSGKVMGVNDAGEFAFVKDSARTLLWENPSPNVAMENGTIINLSSDDYDALDWEYKVGPTSTTLNIQRSVKGHDVQLVYVGYTSQRTFAGRCIVRASDTSYNAQKAFGAIWSNGANVSLNTTDSSINDCCLPVRVYGIKY